MKKSLSLVCFSLLALVWSPALPACDLCGCYTPQLEVVHERPYTFFAAAAEQFTRFDVQRLDGVKVPNPAGEFIDSSITQLVVGAAFFGGRAGFQLSVPLIYRSFQRQLGFGIDRGHVSGLGDITLTANVIALRKEALFHEETSTSSKDGKAVLRGPRGEADFSTTVQLLAGVKLPTGDASRLKENFAEGDDDAPASGIGPHDLTLGTGSVDGVFGAVAEVRYKALFFQADAQYTLRGNGAYQYRFGDDLSWSGGPGIYLYRREEQRIALQCVFSGEAKDYDKFQGVKDGDSSITALYIGPRIVGALSWISGEAGIDLPVIMHTTGLQTAPEYRLRAGLAIHF